MHKNIIIIFILVLSFPVVFLYGDPGKGQTCDVGLTEIINYLPCKVIGNMCQVEFIKRECIESSDPESECPSDCYSTAEMLKSCTKKGLSEKVLVCMAVTD